MVLAPAELRNANSYIMIMICNDLKIRHSYDSRHQRYLGSSIVYRTISLTGIFLVRFLVIVHLYFRLMYHNAIVVCCWWLYTQLGEEWLGFIIIFSRGIVSSINFLYSKDLD